MRSSVRRDMAVGGEIPVGSQAMRGGVFEDLGEGLQREHV